MPNEIYGADRVHSFKVPFSLSYLHVLRVFLASLRPAKATADDTRINIRGGAAWVRRFCDPGVPQAPAARCFSVLPDSPTKMRRKQGSAGNPWVKVAREGRGYGGWSASQPRERSSVVLAKRSALWKLAEAILAGGGRCGHAANLSTASQGACRNLGCRPVWRRSVPEREGASPSRRGARTGALGARGYACA